MGVNDIEEVSSCLKQGIFGCMVDLNLKLYSNLLTSKCVNKSCDKIHQLTVNDVL